MWGLEKFFPPPFVDPLALSFGYVSLTTVCDFFYSNGFHIIMSFEFHFILVFFSLGLILV